MVISAEGPDRARPMTIALGSRLQTLLPYDLEPTSSAFLKTAGTARLILGCDEQHRVGGLDETTERGPCGRGIDVDVLIEKGQLPDVDDIKLHRGRRERDQNVASRQARPFAGLPTNTYTFIGFSYHSPIAVLPPYCGRWSLDEHRAIRLALLNPRRERLFCIFFVSSERTCALSSSFSAFIATLICSRNG